MTVMAVPGTAARHAEVIQGLKNLAEFLKDHPDLPLENGQDPYRVSVRHGTDEENRAEVDRIAAILGVTPGHSGSTHYTAARDFGGGVTYSATAITRRYMASYNAALSYQGSVQAEGREAA